MSFNVVEIKVVTDYTDFSNAVRFSLSVPVTKDAADAITKALAASAWADVSAAIVKAVQASAPKSVQDLSTQLLTAYAGTPSATGGTANNPPPG